MKYNYQRNISLRCDVCGCDDKFESNEDNSYMKCCGCGKEYHGGKDELKELNSAFISEHIEDMKLKAIPDIEKDLIKSIKASFKGNKFIKFK